jgi:hypothetical protein
MLGRRMNCLRRTLPLVTFALVAVHEATLYADAAPAPSLAIDLGGGQSVGMVLVTNGSFTQGSPPTEAGRKDDEAPRRVTLSHAGRSAHRAQRMARASGSSSTTGKGELAGRGCRASMMGERLAASDDSTTARVSLPR